MAAGLFEKYLEDALENGKFDVTGVGQPQGRVLRLKDFAGQFIVLALGVLAATSVFSARYFCRREEADSVNPDPMENRERYGRKVTVHCHRRVVM